MHLWLYCGLWLLGLGHLWNLRLLRLLLGGLWLQAHDVIRQSATAIRPGSRDRVSHSCPFGPPIGGLPAYHDNQVR